MTSRITSAKSSRKAKKDLPDSSRPKGGRCDGGTKIESNQSPRAVVVYPDEVGEALLAIFTSSQAKAAIGHLSDGVRVAGPTAIAYGVAQVTGWDEKLTRRLIRALLDLPASKS